MGKTKIHKYTLRKQGVFVFIKIYAILKIRRSLQKQLPAKRLFLYINKSYSAEGGRLELA